MSAFRDLYRGKRVFVTGHTGFKGAWLCEWLLALGAEVTGYALNAPTEPALFEQLQLARRVRHIVGDIRDLPHLQREITAAHCDFVFHLAAQSLVRQSYAQPVETYSTNVMGTVHLLEALRSLQHPCVVIVVTTDKCYENREWIHAYREEDPLGGHDPYSSSKGAAELVTAAYRRSFFNLPGAVVKLATARSGNVIGGGDWASDRIVPDCMRALQRSEPVKIRNRSATRPWQHVLEPLSGYLWLAACLADPSLAPAGVTLDSSFNFGPALTSNQTVVELVDEILRHWEGHWEDARDPRAVHEAGRLNLATDKAYHLLGWQPTWSFKLCVRNSVMWYRSFAGGSGAAELTRQQIVEYTAAARSQSLSWTR